MNNGSLVRPVLEAGNRVGIPFDETLPDRGTVGPIVVEDLAYEVVPSTPVLRERLETDSAEVLMIEQVASVDQTPFLLQTAYHKLGDPALTAGVLEMNRLGRKVLFDDFFRQMFGIDRGRSVVTIEAVRCDARTARALGVMVSSPTLIREIVYFDMLGAARAVGYSHFRGDNVTLSQTRDASPVQGRANLERCAL